MSDGSCPVCIVGEITDRKCNRCKVEFCETCHGISKPPPESRRNSYGVEMCGCIRPDMMGPLPKAILDAISEHDPDLVKVTPTMFGEGTYYRVDRRNDPPTISLHNEDGSPFENSDIKYKRRGDE